MFVILGSLLNHTLQQVIIQCWIFDRTGEHPACNRGGGGRLLSCRGWANRPGQCPNVASGQIDLLQWAVHLWRLSVDLHWQTVLGHTKWLLPATRHRLCSKVRRAAVWTYHRCCQCWRVPEKHSLLNTICKTEQMLRGSSHMLLVAVSFICLGIGEGAPQSSGNIGSVGRILCSLSVQADPSIKLFCRGIFH